MPNDEFLRDSDPAEGGDFPRISAFGVARDEYLLALEQEGRAEATVKKYRSALARLHRFTGDVAPATIGAVELRRWAISLRDEGLSTCTQHDYLTWVKVWLKWLAGEGGYGVSLASTARVQPPRIVQDPIVPFTEAEIGRMYAACEKHSYRGQRMRAMLSTLLDTGVRASEVLGLRCADLDMETGQITVLPMFDKTRKGRTIALGKRARFDLSRYWSRFRLVPGFDQAPDAQLFIGESGAPLGKAGLASVLDRLGRRAKVADVHPHRFRHTFAILSLQAGMDPFVLMHTLGHKDMAMTKRYLNLVNADVREAKRASSPLDRLKV